MDIEITKSDTIATVVQPPDIRAFTLWPRAGAWDPAEHLDFRTEAITACGAWSQARDRFIKNGDTYMGLVRRARLIAVARALDPEMKSDPGRPEHIDAHCARLACVDWITYTIGRRPALFTKKSARFLDRFIWGYLERTSEFFAFFEARKNGLILASPKSKIQLLSRQCHVGCTYGAPTLASLMHGTGGVKGRGKYPVIFIDDSAYAVLAKNAAGAQLLQMEYTGAGLQRNESGVLNQNVAEKLLALVDPALSATDWPAFVVQRGGQPRLTLHLAPGRRGHAKSDLVDDPNWWRRTPGSLLEVITETRRHEFRANSEETNWGTFEQLLWHLTPVSGSARRYAEFFGAGRSAVHEVILA